MEQSEKENLTLTKYEKFLFEQNPSLSFLLQIIELTGRQLNLETISDYAKRYGMSYNGVKQCRKVIKMFNVKFVAENN